MKALENTLVNQTKLEKLNIYLYHNNIIKIEIKENVEIDVKDLLMIQDVKKNLLQEKLHCVLFLPPKSGVMTKEAREFASGVEVNKNAIAKAVVCSNIGMSIFSRLFIKINKPVVEHKIFQDEEDAMQWLQLKYKSKINSL